LAIPRADDEEDYRTLPFHPEEVTELYLGASMDADDKADIVAAAADKSASRRAEQLISAGRARKFIGCSSEASWRARRHHFHVVVGEGSATVALRLGE
jgi:hypothetical protein